MSDEINWDIDNLRQMVRELNKKGIEAKNKVANIFWQFRYQVTPYWEGENYNNVISFVNEFVHGHGDGDGFKEKTDMLAYEIPKDMENIINEQAVAGGGQAENTNLISAYDSGNSDVWEIPESVVSKDGARRITQEKVQQFFRGTQDPSVRGEVEAAVTKLDEYVAIFDNYEEFTRSNKAAQKAKTQVIEFKMQFVSQTNAMLETVIDVAEAELSGIEQVDLETIRAAHGIADPGDPCTVAGGGNAWGDYEYSDPCAPKSTWTNPCAAGGSGSGWTNPCASAGGRPGPTPTPAWTNPCWTNPCTPGSDGGYWTNPCTSASGRPGTTPTSTPTWTNPCGSTWVDPSASYGGWTNPCTPGSNGGYWTNPCTSSGGRPSDSGSTWVDPSASYGGWTNPCTPGSNGGYWTNPCTSSGGRPSDSGSTWVDPSASYSGWTNPCTPGSDGGYWTNPCASR